MKLNDFRTPAIYGGILVGIIILIELFLFFTCKEGLGCLALMLFFGIPSTLIGIKPGTNFALIANILIYFLIGALIGYLVQKFRK